MALTKKQIEQLKQFDEKIRKIMADDSLDARHYPGIMEEPMPVEPEEEEEGDDSFDYGDGDLEESKDY